MPKRDAPLTTLFSSKIELFCYDDLEVNFFYAFRGCFKRIVRTYIENHAKDYEYLTSKSFMINVQTNLVFDHVEVPLRLVWKDPCGLY